MVFVMYRLIAVMVADYYCLLLLEELMCLGMLIETMFEVMFSVVVGSSRCWFLDDFAIVVKTQGEEFVMLVGSSYYYLPAGVRNVVAQGPKVVMAGSGNH